MTAKKDKTAPERVARDKAKKLASGLVRVNVWVPANKRQALLDYAQELREPGTPGKDWLLK